MASTAIGAAGEDARTITFMSREHKEFIWNICLNADGKTYIMKHWYIVLELTEIHENTLTKFMILKWQCEARMSAGRWRKDHYHYQSWSSVPIT